MSIELAITLYLAGLGLMILEMFVPGGIIGITGFLACIAGIVVAWHIEWYYGVIGLVVTVVITPTMIVIAIKRLSLKKSLVSGDATEGTTADLDHLIGKEGTTSTILRPTGFAVIDRRRVNVVTRGDMLAKNTKISVIKVEGNRVVVRQID